MLSEMCVAHSHAVVKIWFPGFDSTYEHLWLARKHPSDAVVYIRTYLLKLVIPENEISLEFRYIARNLENFNGSLTIYFFFKFFMPLAKKFRRCSYCLFKEGVDCLTDKYWSNTRCCKTCMQARSKAAYAKKLLKKRKRQAEEVVLENDREEERKEDEVSFMYYLYSIYIFTRVHFLWFYSLCGFVCCSFAHLLMLCLSKFVYPSPIVGAESGKRSQVLSPSSKCMPACPRARSRLCRLLYTSALVCLWFYSLSGFVCGSFARVFVLFCLSIFTLIVCPSRIVGAEEDTSTWKWRQVLSPSNCK